MLDGTGDTAGFGDAAIHTQQMQIPGDIPMSSSLRFWRYPSTPTINPPGSDMGLFLGPKPPGVVFNRQHEHPAYHCRLPVSFCCGCGVWRAAGVGVDRLLRSVGVVEAFGARWSFLVRLLLCLTSYALYRPLPVGTTTTNK